MKTIIQYLAFGTFLSLLSHTAMTFAQPAILSERAIHAPAQGRQMLVASEAQAANVGLALLNQGGNAVDAAVATAFALAVTLPRAGNIGGGGFMLIYEQKTSKVIALDYRETAPAKAHRDLFLDAKGDVDKQRSRFSHLAVGVPGTVAGLILALEKYGSLPLKAVLQPAIRLAQKGIIVSPALHEALKTRGSQLNTTAQQAFLKPDGTPPAIGERLVQADLANTLQAIAEQGATGFYQGPVADALVKEMLAHGGIIDHADLATYRPAMRTPIQGKFRGFDIFSMPPPSSGGIHIVQMLNMLKDFDLKASGHNSAASIHILAEVMKLAYADRAKYLGDTDFIKVPVAGLISPAYAQQLSTQIYSDKTRPSVEIHAGKVPGYESRETTHFSVVDKIGNAVANTYTLNFSFGSGIMAPGTGFLLNNEMDDFSAKSGVPNAYGLIGGEANAIEPGKRMLSSMSPTIVLKGKKPYLITGSPGGSRIITTTLQILLNVIEHGMNIQEAVNAPRIHHQWLPDELRLERGLSVDTRQLLKAKGHKLVEKRVMGAANSILIDPETGIKYGAADPRQRDSVSRW
ncbi:gamma-glutamyltransferase [Candidatus Venteria ishoeyi]|uniref:gamma-glutamyltransferase n=1 Tax=Candidatus Venteria ishoeyi TaxID=1899563 RepID=UPI0025A533AA|nr:gamma-glutamyltransferase [Candidatus Venteria ishoeyi]MDM8547500.1 gamma-glutamyltransferase [Candidatus Venteria ishoeyi]